MSKTAIASMLKGTLQSFFRLNSVALKVVSGALQVRNSADSADASLKAAAIQLSTGAAANRILVSDASGNGVWTDGLSLPAATQVYPTSAVCWHQDSFVDSGYPINLSASATQIYNFLARQYPAAAVNDQFHQRVLLASSTAYNFTVLGSTSPGSGIVEWTIDGAVIGTQDWYSSASVANALKSISGVNLAAGEHVISGRITGKNAASSNYFLFLTRFSLFTS